MRLVLIGFAALMALASAAEARDGCGGGFFFNGVRCVPMRAAPPPGFRPPQPRAWAPAGPDRWGQPTYFPGPRGSCPPRYTVQDGVCKPYRGF